MPTEIVTYPWTRYWVPQGENPVMEDGYFVEPHAERLWFGSISNGMTLSALNDIPCLVLLGDVGMGKTTVIEQAAEQLVTALRGQKHEVVRRDLKRLTEQQIYRTIFGDPKVEGWIRGEHALTLFLDSLDECWRRIDELESILVGELERARSATKMPLFLRLTCRSADWRGEAGNALRRIFPSGSNASEQIRTYTLAPLSKSNIREAAASRARDGDDLLTRIAEKDAQALASHPITFEMLLQIYLEGGDFPTSRTELYERGCLHLCTDRHAEFGATQQKGTTPAQRLVLASRFAAASVLTNRYLINGDTERPLSRPDVLEIEQLVGYFEESAGGERVRVDRAAATEVLQTALFTDRVDGVQTWRHQSYGEFLSARYLAQRRVSIQQLVELLTDTTDNVGRIIPQLEEMACWLADLNPKVFDVIAPANADVFIRCDPRTLEESRRALLVESYLNLIRRHEAPEVDWQLKNRFARLNHSALPDQLGTVIVDRTEHPLVREAAIDIAAFCRCRSLGTELSRVFLDPDDVFRLRKHAGFALDQMACAEICAAVKAKATPASFNDSHDEVKGFYLTLLTRRNLWMSLSPLFQRIYKAGPARR